MLHTIQEMATVRHKLMIQQRITWPSATFANEQPDMRCSIQIYRLNQPHKRFYRASA